MKNFILLISVLLTISCKSQNQKNMNFNILSEKEKKIVVNKGTELPFSGKFYKHYYTGTYLCKQCNAPLYRSSDKFDAQCGWPSFDDQIPNAVKRQTDADGHRTEILCNNCGAHLGHVFEGEGFTTKNTRHCVNSISMNFIPVVLENQIKIERAIFAGGCFWGVEYHFQKQNGVISTTVGYIGGTSENPSYEEVCSHTTGYAEAVEVFFNPEVVSYEQLAKLFFEIHDPTQNNRQGPDVGDQYRSEIFYCTENQKNIAQNLIEILKSKGYKVVTKLSPANTEFYWAEEYHQDYYKNKGTQPYCHIYTKRF